MPRKEYILRTDSAPLRKGTLLQWRDWFNEVIASSPVSEDRVMVECVARSETKDGMIVNRTTFGFYYLKDD